MTDGEAPKLRLGGMALRNGLLVHGPTHWAVAIRSKDGSIQVRSGRKPHMRGVDGVPGLRGLARLGEAFAVLPLVKHSLPEVQLPFQNRRVLGAMAGAGLTGALLRRSSRGGVQGEVAAALISLAPALIALRGGELAAYHGVEHKAIAAYEQDSDASEASKEHDRCGSHLMAPMLASNLAGTALLHHVMESPGRLAGGALALASAGVAVEVFAWSERHSGTATARALRRPGHELQRVIGTREPDERQLDVGRAALAEILRAEEVAAPRAPSV
jgi:uncharacterized protein YqhQ